MSRTYCLLCHNVDSAPFLVNRFEGDDIHEIDPRECDMELEGNDLSVCIVDGDVQYIAHFGANYCPCCGRRLR